ncbi:HAMP domain-containing protein [Bacillus sp. FJAT-49711]|uniref:sensor histidine kinase n=1 Tax=Bacillus sp. FJAT-49711 TaxID=2833585 RepID=UPI001BC8FA6D|nr:ATP-binding protein [Bacillus sp. FJAT-49711]MBS4220392.1 HAMP domain-containing protein [Bacillus sp. FJAT-49711]
MKLGLARKLSLALLIAFIVSIISTYFFSFFLYERLYVQNMKEEMLDTGTSLAESYESGTISEKMMDEINWFNSKSKFEIFAVKNPRELSMCLPFEMDYEALINGEEREQLLKGDIVFKKGRVDRLDREVISAVIPLLDEKRLEGIIYIYYPLAKLNEMTFQYTIYWLVGAAIFLLIALTMGNKWIKSLLTPMVDMKIAAQELADGNLSTRINHYHDDEIGQLAKTFNKMAESIQIEDEQRKEFLANVSHELRTPLSHIKGYMEAIQMGIVSGKDVHKYQQIIVRESKRMERLVDDLLELAKLESKEFSLKKAPISLAQTIEEAIEKSKPRMLEKGIDLVYQLDYELIVEADAERLEQAFLNILDNAIRYSAQNSTIKISLIKEDSDFALLAIEDNGSGIPKEDLKKITERFYRVNKARTRKEGGTGLGLSIVEKLIKLHQGTLNIKSSVGKGTIVFIRLPLINFNKK